MPVQKEKVTTSETSDAQESSTQERARAEDDVIAYAETNVSADNASAAKPKVLEPKKQDSGVKDNLHADTSLRVEGVDGLTGRKIWAPIEDINNINRTIYVESLHTPQPIILAVQYRATGHFREVVMRIDEKTFNELSLLPKFSKPINTRHSYVSDFLQNDPNQGQLLQRTYQVSYPEWIKMEDILKQDKENVKYYGVKLTGELEKKLFPAFKAEKVEDTQEQKEARQARKQAAAGEEIEIEDEFSNEKPSLQEAMIDG